MQIITDQFGEEIVIITNENGSTLSMSKTHWDKLEAEKELGGTL